MLASVSHDPNSVITGTVQFLGQDDQKEVQHDSFGHVMPVAPALASCAANGIINGTIAFV